MLRLDAQVLLHHRRVRRTSDAAAESRVAVTARIIRARLRRAANGAARRRCGTMPLAVRSRTADADRSTLVPARLTLARPAPPLGGADAARGRSRGEAGGRCRGARRRPRRSPPGETVYGVNTGFGLLARTRIDDARLAELQRALVLSHSRRHRAAARRCRRAPRHRAQGRVARARPLGRALGGDRGARRARQRRRRAVHSRRRARSARPATWRRSRIWRRC